VVHLPFARVAGSLTDPFGLPALFNRVPPWYRGASPWLKA
jgi:hypothetical protein